MVSNYCQNRKNGDLPVTGWRQLLAESKNRGFARNGGRASTGKSQ
ncbi:vitamin B12-binding protein [Ligilactobacillus ruminis]|uniref:Vitamin B12-binding protein n=1 Tax=Ligilactobacillus ruminis TaxID=1623 RepID=A0A8B2ZF10_9LACO|nr:vitamin B12-binding protein [Ligilactobacillus ruminis]